MKIHTIVAMSMLVTSLASACASTEPNTDPVSVIEAFHEALNNGDLDAAMSFVADDAKFITDTLYTGKAEVRGFYERVLGSDPHYELSDFKLEGDTVTWIAEVTQYEGEFSPTPTEAVVQNGKIVSLIVS